MYTMGGLLGGADERSQAINHGITMLATLLTVTAMTVAHAVYIYMYVTCILTFLVHCLFVTIE